MRALLCVAVALTAGLEIGSGAPTEAAPPVVASPPAVEVTPAYVPLNEERILKVIPDYQTVEDTSRPVAGMTAAEKWNLGLRETVDPFNIATAAMTAAFSQRGNQTPKYGEGWPDYGRRFGAAVGDFGTQSFFSAGVFATLLKQDPRYFRAAPGTGVARRVWYSATRLFVCRNDAGQPVFNSSNLLGMGAGIAASNLYYPAASRTGTVMAGRIETSLFGGVTGNLMSEFWPDLERKFFHKKPKS